MTPPQTTETRQAPNTAPEHHPLIEELAAKTDIPPETLVAMGVTVKPDARVPKAIREAEPHLPDRLEACVLPLVSLNGSSSRSFTFRAAERWRTTKDASVKWHSGGARISEKHLAIAPGGKPTWKRPVVIAEGLTDTLTAHHTIRASGMEADVVGAPGVWRAAAMAAECAEHEVDCFLLMDNDKPDQNGIQPGRKATASATKAFYDNLPENSDRAVFDVGEMLPEGDDTTDMGGEWLAQALSDVKSADPPPPPPPPPPPLEVTKSGLIVASRDNPDDFAHMLAMLGVEVRYDERAAEAHMSVTGGKWEQVTDMADSDLRLNIERSVRYAVPKRTKKGKKSRDLLRWRVTGERWRLLMQALLYQHRYDPFLVDYLDVLPEWDGTPRDPLFDVFADTPRTPISEFGGTYHTRAAIVRAHEPGAASHIMPVLVGRRGTGKSTWIAHSVPQGRGWAVDGFNFAGTEQQQIEKLLGAVAVEADEMTGVTARDLNYIKSFLSRSTLKHRLPYDKRPSRLPRRDVMLGTANNPQCLPNDPTGERRLLPFWVDGPTNQMLQIIDYWHRNRDQIWAEQLVQYQALGASLLNPPPEVQAMHDQHADTFKARSDDEDMLLAWLRDEQPDSITVRELVTLAGVLGETGLPPDPRLQKLAAKSLRAEGYQQSGRRTKNADGSRHYLWERFEGPSTPSTEQKNLGFGGVGKGKENERATFTGPTGLDDGEPF